ncbi:hypothetical protein C5167_001732 [Papaver somniferum]|uniref:Uncharacterized protein n=1 Tax=Papaver somniferum TaxID=3469 RepID=A0A4Y7L034_PAPSO|nr:hypothetical protein C5167_001732 [Papaver somniferum]
MGFGSVLRYVPIRILANPNSDWLLSSSYGLNIAPYPDGKVN